MISGGAARILVVEDEALIMMATVDMLCELGHKPVTARCGQVALALIEREVPFDAMLTDVNLPDMDGQALAVEVRRRSPRMPIVFATGYRMTVVGGFSESGPTAVLSKPYLPRELAEALKRILPDPEPVP